MLLKNKILKIAAVSHIFEMQTEPRRCLSVGMSLPAIWYSAAAHKYLLANEEITEFFSFYNELDRFDFSQHNALHTAVRRLNSSYDVGTAYKIIDLMIGLEALYLAEEQELAYKLAIRAAFLLGDSEERRKSIYKVLRKAYKVRSKMVHGDKPLKNVEIGKGRSLVIDEHVYQVEDILRESINRFIDLLKQYSHKQLLTSILDDNILDSGKMLRNIYRQ